MDEPVPDYEYMCRSLYALQFGTISFMKLVELFEEALHIRPSNQTEKAEADRSVGEGGDCALHG
jgi:hypothetical protein